MAFPVSPANNQTAIVNGINYIYDSRFDTWTRYTSANYYASNGVLINNSTISQNMVIGAGTNGLSVGPLTINSGVTVTVTSGQRHIII
jgi:hypothetical protein